MNNEISCSRTQMNEYLFQRMQELCISGPENIFHANHFHRK